MADTGMGMGQAGGYGQMAGGVTQSLIGGYAFIKAEEMRKKYNKLGVPAYSEDVTMMEARRRAEAASKYGFSPEQRSAFFQNLSRLNNTRANRAINAGGGNQSQAIQAGINFGSVGALNNFAGQDAQLQKQNQQYADSFARNLQAIKNMNTQNKYSAYVDQGRAISQMRDNSLKNIVGGSQTFAGGAATVSDASGSDADKYQVPQNTYQAGVNYDPNNSGYNQGYQRNEWLYGYQQQPQQIPNDPYQQTAMVTPKNYVW